MSRAEEGWEEAARNIAGVARSNLQRLQDEGEVLAKKTRILAAFRRRRRNTATEFSLFDKRNPDELSFDDQAVFLWLENLGPAFSMPLEGHMLRTYARVEDFILAILDRTNAVIVVNTLELSLQRFECTWELSADVMTRDARVTYTEKLRRLDFWKILAGSSRDSLVHMDRGGLFNHLKRWKSAWACHGYLEGWSAFGVDRRRVCERLVEGAILWQMLVQDFTCSFSSDRWLELEEQRLQGLYRASCSKRKPEGMVAGYSTRVSKQRIETQGEEEDEEGSEEEEEVDDEEESEEEEEEGEEQVDDEEDEEGNW